jgi:hypothetical protein
MLNNAALFQAYGQKVNGFKVASTLTPIWAKRAFGQLSPMWLSERPEPPGSAMILAKFSTPIRAFRS